MFGSISHVGQFRNLRWSGRLLSAFLFSRGMSQSVTPKVPPYIDPRHAIHQKQGLRIRHNPCKCCSHTGSTAAIEIADDTSPSFGSLYYSCHFKLLPDKVIKSTASPRAFCPSKSSLVLSPKRYRYRENRPRYASRPAKISGTAPGCVTRRKVRGPHKLKVKQTPVHHVLPSASRSQARPNSLASAWRPKPCLTTSPAAVYGCASSLL